MRQTPTAPVTKRSRAATASSAEASARLRIAVIGTTPTALVTASALAGFGHRVWLTDLDNASTEHLQNAADGTEEPGLAERLRAQQADGHVRLAASTDSAFGDVDIVFIAVATPVRDDASVDTAAVDRAVQQLQRLAVTPAAVVIQSAVPVGTARRLQAMCGAPAEDARGPVVLSLPEALREGTALQDFLQPSRIVVGADEPAGTGLATLMRALRPLADAGVPIVVMDTASAELARAAANAMLALRVSFVNEIALIAAATGADIEQVCEGIGSDPRIGRDFLRAGAGYGGAALPSDIASLRLTAREHSLRADMLRAAERVNGRQRTWAFEALQRDMGSTAAMRGLRVALWGLSFKPDSTSMKEAPSLALIERLVRAGVFVQLHDPAAMPNARAIVVPDRRVSWADTAELALVGADALILVTEWPMFVAADPAMVAAALRQGLVYDCRNAVDAVRWRDAGLRVAQVGRPDAGKRSTVSRANVASIEPVAHRIDTPSHAALSAALR